MTKRKIEFTVHGVPRPKGSATSFVRTDKDGEPYRDKSGRIIPTTIHGTRNTAAWEALVKHAATAAIDDQQLGQIFTGAVRVSRSYQFQRPKTHFIASDRQRGDLRASAPSITDHLQNPDVDKLDRCCNDALQGAVIVNDNRIVESASRKEWTCRSSRMHVTVEEI